MSGSIRAGLALLLLLPAVAQAAPAWPDTPLARVAALALVEELRADLLAETSATATLERWCGTHGLSAAPRVVAERQSGPPVPAANDVRDRLQVMPEEPLGYRHVLLRCGGHVLSDAQNWFVPSRLTPEMNRVLDTTDTPFGKAVRELNFQRQTVASRLLWRPLPEEWTRAPLPEVAGGMLDIPARLIENRAVLLRGDDRLPFAEVIERYTDEVLAFPAPAAR